MLLLKQSTAVTVKIGPFIDDTDGKTAETALTLSQADIRLSKNGANIAQKTESSASSHDELGYYDCDLDTTDTGTLGRLKLMVHESGALPVWHEFTVVPANIYDSLVGGTDTLEADAIAISGDETAANNAESFFDGTGYAGTNNVIPTVTTLTGHTAQTGDNYARLGAPAGASVSADIAAVEAQTDDIGAAGAGLTAVPWNATWDAEVQSEVTDALTAYDPPTKAELDSGLAGLNDLTAAAVNAEVDTAIADASLATAAALATVDGIVDTILLDTAELQTDWVNGGRLDLIVDAILADTNELQSDDVPTLIAALPDAAAINAEVDTALADIHLDHLLAADYDPASKPGVATALLNELVENDAGVSRYTVNALENAPSGTGASAATIADAVWDEAIADHAGAGSTGEALGGASAPSAATVADAVWDEAKAGHTAGGSFGEEVQAHSLSTEISALNDLSAAEVNAEADTAIADAALATAAALATVDGIVDAILVDTAEIGAAGAGLTAVPWNAAWDAEVQSEVTDALNVYDPPKKGEMDAGFAAQNDPTVEEIRAEIDSNSTQLAAIVADTNELQTDDVPSLIAALPDAAAINAQVDAAFTTQMADSVPADGTIPTREQALYMINQFLLERAVSGTTVTVKKADGSTALMTLTLDDGTSPTSITRAT